MGINQSILIDLDHNNYGWDDHAEEEIFHQMEMDDKVPEMQSQEQISTSGGVGGGTCSLQDSSASGNITTKRVKTTTLTARKLSRPEPRGSGRSVILKIISIQ